MLLCFQSTFKYLSQNHEKKRCNRSYLPSSECFRCLPFCCGLESFLAHVLPLKKPYYSPSWMYNGLPSFCSCVCVFALPDWRVFVGCRRMSSSVLAPASHPTTVPWFLMANTPFCMVAVLFKTKSYLSGYL